MSKKNSTSRAALQSVLPGVPMLSLQENNIIDVQEALNTLCLREFQSIGEAIQTLALSTIAVVPDAPTDLTGYTPEQDPGGFKAKAYQDKVRRYQAEDNTRNKELHKLYGYVLSVLSRESREIVISDATFATIQTDMNGFNLWTLVYNLHTTGSATESEDSRKDRANTAYAELRQDSTTDTTTHFLQFKMAVKRVQDLKASTLTHKGQAIRFIKSLSDVQHGEIKWLLCKLN
jgi:hypothetical protein